MDEEEDYDDFDEDDEFEREEDMMRECICGAFQWSDKLARYIRVADCCCGCGL